MSPLLLNPTNNNEFFIGTNYLQYGTVPNATLQADASDPNVHSLTGFNVSSVAMSRNNGNVVYYSLYHEDNLGIFRATRTGTTWVISNITNNLTALKQKQFVTDIAVDPSNENRIWVTIGGFKDRTKVFKTENGGTTWENVSGCLPNFPVLSICYQEGSNDRLYVDRSDFSDNAIGIHSEGANYIFARGDKFKVGKTGLTVSPDDIHEGIISMSSTALYITESTFLPTFSRASDPVTIGLRVRENGANDNSIYRNIFKKELATNSNKFYGNLANGINRNTAGSGIGLKYICNTHQNNILNGFDIAVTDIGIELSQGSANFAAGNKFSLGTIAGGAPAGSDFKNSSISNINYFHANSPLAEIPQNITGISKTLATNYSCPIIYNPDELDDGFVNDDAEYSPYSRIHAIVGSLLLDKDSTNLIAIRLWLSREDNIENLMTTVETYLQEDNAELAEETLHEAITRFTLDEPTKKEFDYYVTLKRMQIRWIRSNTNIFTIPQSDLEVLRNLAENSSARAGDAARGLLNFAYHTQYFIPPTLPKETGGKGIEATERTENTTKTNATNVTLIAFPNPASHIVNFEYHTQDRTLNGAAEVVVRNTLGQVIKRFKMTSDGLVTWNIESLEGGIYYYSLENAEKVIITAQQLIIAK